jgi:hypothetical protein
MNRIIAAAVATLLLQAGSAHASVTFQYTGKTAMFPYGQVYPGFEPDMGPRLYATAVFDGTVVTETFTGTLTANMFSGSLGLSTETSANPAFSYAGGGNNPYFFTFVNGQVTAWNVGTYMPTSYNHPFIGTVNYYRVMKTSSATGDYMNDEAPVLWLPYQSVAGQAGTWTREMAPSAVPLPLPLPLLALGMAGLGAVRRRRAV